MRAGERQALWHKQPAWGALPSDFPSPAPLNGSPAILPVLKPDGPEAHPADATPL